MDKIFKIGLLVLGFLYLAYLFCPIANQTGRYQYHEDSDSISAFDTITGLVYRCDSEDVYDRLSDGGIVDIIAWAKFAEREAEREEKENIEQMLK